MGRKEQWLRPPPRYATFLTVRGDALRSHAPHLSLCKGGVLSRAWDPHRRSAARLPLLREARGFAPPPHGGFAFIAAPERPRMSRSIRCRLKWVHPPNGLFLAVERQGGALERRGNQGTNLVVVPRPECILTSEDESAMNPSGSTVENRGSTVIIPPCTSLPITSTPRHEGEGVACASTYPVKSKTLRPLSAPSCPPTMEHPLPMPRSSSPRRSSITMPSHLLSCG